MSELQIRRKLPWHLEKIRNQIGAGLIVDFSAGSPKDGASPSRAEH
jgi:hypothetical protein